MKLILQTVSNAKVLIKEKVINEINKGLLIYVGFEKDDNNETIEKASNKIVNFRVFENFSKSIKDINGEILLISNFTLPAITKKGTKPNFKNSMDFKNANILYEKLLNQLNHNIITKSGIFGENMQIISINEGPINIIMEL